MKDYRDMAVFMSNTLKCQFSFLFEKHTLPILKEPEFFNMFFFLFFFLLGMNISPASQAKRCGIQIPTCQRIACI